MNRLCQALLGLIFSASTLIAQELNQKEQLYINHVQSSIQNACRHESGLDPEVFKIHGMSSYKMRHLLNNICSLENARYLEIGSWKGSTFVAALFNNQDTLQEAISVENFSEFGSENPKEHLLSNLAEFLGEAYPYRLVFQDCFALDTSALFKDPINIYFFDGNHSYQSQEKAFTYYNDVLDDVFITLVDDWNFEGVPEATKHAFDLLGYTVLYEAILPSAGNSDMLTWWNGVYVAVIRK
ncbi:MAG: hypothetical protein SP1CHLAM54_11130 [Chlamydiia bacterium]|nr:hypothetical protein [Chlamydiia bacterium]MCH9616016.1 hypothetical protein [Chlamydiia bacterium]MCH9629039.1 hypothetical protein [Chlamydiia bacterium]